ncbi:chloride channel protein [Cognatishimia activa]|uniref:H(+)/Cl(-) exchange transporter ClcA n=1 Tax=Cognatishimia activa TaxID=1715691 RepID=A0A0P1IVU7_9RHOB|nr:chloride channel protein [Cognatishimia activa]MEE2945039.1 chloride channel protein [Pseudomonadota bacterium]CUJ20399.1 H(+)/Cl(-) exchange transporter ClcA [Cognatishimia activa]CUK25501.1 H(+)/Cl(-) exchange transporter ClcA [Cognatishimia activa]
MAHPLGSFLADSARQAGRACRGGWKVLLTQGPSKFQFWLIALLIGTASGFAALTFRRGIEWFQGFVYRTENINRLHSFAETLPWYWILIVPILGGLVVGLLLDRFSDDARAQGPADVIAAAALNNGRLSLREGFASIAASFVTLSTGGSTGREGPVVHFAGVISTWVSQKIQANGITGRDLLGCAVAAAVSASFNAPIAGALFALEVVLRHFAVHAFAPIVIASVAGTVISRLEFGNVTEFMLPMSVTAFYQELPAFLLLGGVCGFVAVALMWTIFWAEDMAHQIMTHSPLKRWMRPVISGAMLGLLAIFFPHIIGVGYETTSAALSGEILLHEAIVFVALKIIAVAITMAGRMGGGVFSPALMVGALTGLAFGLIATSIFPEVSGSHTLYALAGMGGVAAAVLGAPISTTLIVFELTGDWQTGLAVMVTVSISTALGSRLVDRSFFLTQLERRGLHVAAGPQAYLLGTRSVSSMMREVEADKGATEEACWALIEQNVYASPNATLETLMPMFENTSTAFIPVIQMRGEGAGPELLGAVHHVDALKAYNKALAETAAEEHS